MRINLYDLEQAAREALPTMAWDYYDSGAHDEITLRENVAAWQRHRLRYRVLAGVGTRSLETTVLGQPTSMPICVAPTAFHKLAHPDGELATARAAGSLGTIMTLSSLSTTDVEDVVAAATGPVFFQLYVYKDRAATRALVQRAVDAGCKALVVTVDAPLLGTRERDVRNRFHLPEGLTVRNMTAHGLDKVAQVVSDSGLGTYVRDLLDQNLSWSDLDWLASIAELPIVLKGVVRGDDAARAVDHGVAAIQVSNHGGRQLDTAVATGEVLEEVAAAGDGRAEVFVDGGIRRGTDVVKAIALGARAVFVGRPVLWGLAANGQTGVEEALGMLRDELDLAMALCGCVDVDAITGDLIA